VKGDELSTEKTLTIDEMQKLIRQIDG